VTRGADGCESFAPGRESVKCASFRVKAVDTTAAGDTFTGYYLAALASGADEATALRHASAAAAISVTRHGAADSIPSAAEVDAFLADRQ
jgi:ribokinase